MPQTRRRIFLSLVLIGAFALLCYLVGRPDRTSLEYQVERWTELRPGPVQRPTTLGGWFDLRVLRWWLSGKPGFSEWFEELERQRKTLVLLGYFEERWVPWPEPDLVLGPLRQEFTVAKQGWVSVSGERLGEALLTGRPADLEEFQRAVRAHLESK